MTNRFDLDVLRGWTEKRDRELDGTHRVPALASLVYNRKGQPLQINIHGPDVYVGRFHPQHGPVDLLMEGLDDHELYKVSAPHARISLGDGKTWFVRPLSPSSFTYINDRLLSDTRERYPLIDGDVLRLGVVPFEFEVKDLDFETWRGRQKDLLLAVEEPSIFLMRAGAVCGPNYVLNKNAHTVIGRTFPEVLAAGHRQPSWDLSGLKDEERKHIGLRHAEFWCEDEDWYILPMSPRQRTYVNRIEVTGVTPLMPGDEIGLGAVLFHFHHPSNIRASTNRRTVELPAILNWREEHARRKRAEETQ